MRYTLVTITTPDGESYGELRERKDGQWVLYSDLEQQHREYLEARDAAEALRAYAELLAEAWRLYLFDSEGKEWRYSDMSDDEWDVQRERAQAIARTALVQGYPGSGDPAASNEAQKRTFSDFIRNAEGEERAKVFERVIDKSIERQRHETCTHDYVEWTNGLGQTGRRCSRCGSEFQSNSNVTDTLPLLAAAVRAVIAQQRGHTVCYYGTWVQVQTDADKGMEVERMWIALEEAGIDVDALVAIPGEIDP